jgi:hypothetical protein
VDHTSVALFDEIPAEYLAEAQAMAMFYTDRSVGSNVNEGLDCLASPHDTSADYCRRWEHPDPAFNTTPADVYWPGVYPREKWQFVSCTEVACTLAQYAATPVAAFGYFPSYLEAPALADSFFVSDPDGEDIYDLAAAEAAHPETTMIYFTSSLSRGEVEATRRFNDRMRAWATDNGRVLFDMADILSHTPQDQECFDNRDGVLYYFSDTQWENHPDDGLDTPAICPHYATEADGGHLGSVSAGKIRAAKAFWVLMAQLAGWQPNGGASPTPTPTAGPSATPPPTYTPTATSVPTGSTHVGDLDGGTTLAGESQWRANVKITAHDAAHAPLVGAVVSGIWSVTGQVANCTTKTDGGCTVTSSQLGGGVAAIGFTVTGVAYSVHQYVEAENHDPDADSNGTTISMVQPPGLAPSATPTPVSTAPPVATPTPSADDRIHIGDMDGTATVINATTWRAAARVVIHRTTETPVVGAVVAGYWGGDPARRASCTTRLDGGCTISGSQLSFDTFAVSFTVVSVTHPAYTYDETANHDPDGDADLTSIMVTLAPSPPATLDSCALTYQEVGLTPFAFARSADNQAAVAQAAASIDGHFAFLSIGHSITLEIARSAEREWLPTLGGRNPEMVMLSGATAGVTADKWADPNHGQWQVVFDRLTHYGATPEQVEVVWMKLAYIGTGADYNSRLVSDMEATLANLKARFPNLALVYVSPHIRRYTFDVRATSSEPTGYWTGAAVQEFVARHERDTAPAVTYGPNLWSDDPAIWEAADYQVDCVHLSPAGETKAGRMLIDWYASDPTASSWFLASE